MALQKGMQVEILFLVMQLGASYKRNYRGAWAEGVLLDITRGICKLNVNKYLIYNDKSLIKVKSFIRDVGDSFVELYVGYVRPTQPPRLFPLDFLDGVVLEASETNFWWSGFIVKDISYQCHKFWLVSFPHTNILTTYPLSTLHPAQEWLDGKWTCCSCCNTLHNFGLHSISELFLVLYIVVGNTKAYFMIFLVVLWSLLHVGLTIIFWHV